MLSPPRQLSAQPARRPIAPSSCGANNKDVQEFTAGYWWNIYNSANGRLRQGIQYSLFRRDLWSGSGRHRQPRQRRTRRRQHDLHVVPVLHSVKQ